MHVLVARVLYELWELRSAISAANAILMYASELMLEGGGGASNETFQRVSTFLLFETPCCLSRVRYEPEFPSNLRLYMYPSSVNSFFFPPFFFFFFELTVQTSVSGSSTQFHGRIIIVPLIVRRNGVLGGEHKRNSFLF